VLRSEPTDTTLVYIRKPAAGNWTVSALPGSAPIVGVDHAEGVDAPAMTAVVGRKKGSSSFSLDVKQVAQPGMKVDLVELGAGGKASSLQTVGAKASSVLEPVARAAQRFRRVRFRPAEGLGRQRRIVANVSIDGVPWKRVTLARYTAPRPVVPRPPRRARVREVRGGLLVSFRPGRGTRGTSVVVTTATGRTLTATARRGARSVRVRGYRRGEGAQVTVQGVIANGVRLPRAAGARVRPAPPKPVVIGAP
jgi:hypothetical protein